jgi:protein required for attachment to host cells
MALPIPQSQTHDTTAQHNITGKGDSFAALQSQSASLSQSHYSVSLNNVELIDREAVNNGALSYLSITVEPRLLRPVRPRRCL